MGLPAFDMSAFEAAQAAVATQPRAFTTIFGMTPSSGSVGPDELRETVRKQTDEIIASYENWRVSALTGAANLRVLLGYAVLHMPAGYLVELSTKNKEQVQVLKWQRDEFKRTDETGILEAYNVLSEYAFIPNDAKKFLKKEIKRVETMSAQRLVTFDRIILSISDMSAKLDEYIEKNSLISPQALSPAALQAHLDQSLIRQPDLDGVAERTARRLRAFPKVAEHLGR